ncbi:MAG TPA: HD-GYP domain-containing protein [Candidatus Binatia bacterium]|nr:HD-GYP domain-containing protein [Candidatus Binatia bacterium]
MNESLRLDRRRERAAGGATLPTGYELLQPDVLDGLENVPCPVFVGLGGRAVLYAVAGAQAGELRRRLQDGRPLLIRREDAELLRTALVAALPRVLTSGRLSPPSRTRVAYAMTSHIVAPLFSPRSPIGRGDLVAAREAVDVVLKAVLVEEDLLWSMVATMQRHLRTHTHAVNTAVYAAILGRAVFGPRSDLRDIGRGALLHDIGKNRVPTRILDKPGPLDADEWRIMRRHPEVGYEIVVSSLGEVPSYAHIILDHHERADGSGYPSGRPGSAVPLDSQVVAITDAFDALTSDRPYKAASTPFEALRIMRFEMAGQFDDRLLQVFIGLIGARDGFRRSDYRALEAGPARPLSRLLTPAGLRLPEVLPTP